MKKHQKLISAVLLAGTVLLSLSGCNRGGTEDTQSRKEFYYVPEYQNLDIGVDYIQRLASAGDNIYMYGSSWDEGAEVSREYLYRYQTMDGVIKEFPIDTGDNSSIQQMCIDSEGNLVMLVSRYAIVSEEEPGEAEGGETAEGEMQAEDGSQETVGEMQEEIADDTTEDTAEASETAAASDGAEAVISTGNSYDYFEEYKTYLELWKVSGADGSVLSKTDITEVFDDPDTYVQYMITDGQDNIYMSSSSADYFIYLLDKDGGKVGEISLDNWVEGLFASKEGQVYMQTWGEEGRELYPVDFQTKKLGDAVKSETLSESAYYNQVYYTGLEKGILISDSNGAYTYDFETDTKEELLEWLDADINSDDVDGMGQMSDGRLWVFLRDYSAETDKYSLAILTKTPSSEMVEKEELVYGTMWVGQDIRKNIIEFNKTNEKYHISVKEYGTGDDYMEGLTQFNNDVASGSGPDIIDISGFDYKQYASKGVLEDLYPYMEKDNIAREDYLENVLEAYESEGKLCGILPQFYVTTTVAKASKVGDTPGWTLDEMLSFAENSQAENVFSYGSRSSVFYYCIYNNIDEFIDWEEGKCYFNTDDFIRVLEFANRFPEEPDYNDDEGTSSKLRTDKILLMQTSLSSVQEYQMMNGLFGEKVTYIGYPNSERSGNLIQPVNGCVSINAKSKHKDGAWEFVKRLISKEYQDSLVSGYSTWGFPVRKDALNKMFEKDMTPEYYEDADGNQVEQMKTSWGYDDFNIDIYAATQEEVDAVEEIIYSANRSAGSINEELSNIITEETEAFFKGQKSAKDTADIIQNRIQVYVNENS